MLEPAPFSFEAEISRFDYGKYFYACVYLPADVIEATQTGTSQRARFDGEIAGRAWNGAAQPGGEGRAFLILSASFLRRAGLAEGDRVSVALQSVDPDEVREPSVLRAALDAAPDLAQVWDGLTAGTRRGFVHRITSAKRPETVEKRVAEVLSALEEDDPSPYPKRR